MAWTPIKFHWRRGIIWAGYAVLCKFTCTRNVSLSCSEQLISCRRPRHHIHFNIIFSSSIGLPNGLFPGFINNNLFFPFPCVLHVQLIIRSWVENRKFGDSVLIIIMFSPNVICFNFLFNAISICYCCL